MVMVEFVLFREEFRVLVWFLLVPIGSVLLRVGLVVFDFWNMLELVGLLSLVWFEVLAEVTVEFVLN